MPQTTHTNAKRHSILVVYLLPLVVRYGVRMLRHRGTTVKRRRVPLPLLSCSRYVGLFRLGDDVAAGLSIDIPCALFASRQAFFRLFTLRLCSPLATVPDLTFPSVTSRSLRSPHVPLPLSRAFTSCYLTSVEFCPVVMLRFSFHYSYLLSNVMFPTYYLLIVPSLSQYTSSGEQLIFRYSHYLITLLPAMQPLTFCRSTLRSSSTRAGKYIGRRTG